jgi:phosphoribosyl 1,2-cyclic phosphodiesterase
MSLKICVLASGSRGNCTLVASPSARILVDAGLSGRRTVECLARLGIGIGEIDAIVIGHEHSDHVRGLPALAGRHRRPVYLNRETAEAAAGHLPERAEVKIFTNGQSWEIGDLSILPFSVFHDSRDPVGFVIGWRGREVTIATDLGTPTRLVRQRLKNARVAILEANHDPDLLLNGTRPWRLKQRVNSSRGHLSNQAAADLLAAETGPNLTDVFLAHISLDCNRPEQARRTVLAALKRTGREHVRVRLTYQDRISEVVEIEDGPPPAPAAEPPIPRPVQLELGPFLTKAPLT